MMPPCNPRLVRNRKSPPRIGAFPGTRATLNEGLLSHIVKRRHRLVGAGRLRVRRGGQMILACLFVSAAAFGQTNPKAMTVPTVASSPQPSVQRFEVGATMGISPEGPIGPGDESLKLFAGVSANYAPRSWFAVGAEVEWLYAPQNNSSDCYGCVASGIQTLALVELRTPLGHDAVRLFGRVAAGSAFVTGTDGESSVLPAGRVTIGVDLRLWHFYARPFGFVGAMTTFATQFGFGFETGAAF